MFPKKQLLIYTDEVIATPNGRPGDGRKSRIPAKWRAFSQDLKTIADDDVNALRRKRSLDWQYYPSKNGRILRMNNISEFCAWAKDKFVHEVEFVDLGIFSGKDDCDKPYDYYYRTQHPENVEAFYQQAGGPGGGIKNPFLGRPSDAMYGDFFFLETEMEQQRVQIRSSGRHHRVNLSQTNIDWKRLGDGDIARGRGKIRYRVTIRSEDILPIKILDVIMAANAEERGGKNPRRVAVDAYNGDRPIVLAPGEVQTFEFEETDSMRDIVGQNIRVHFFVEFENPRGTKGTKHTSAYYFQEE